MHTTNFYQERCNAKFSTFLIISVTIFLMAVSCGDALSANVTLAWDQSTEPDVAGYKLYYGTQTHTYSQAIDAYDYTSYGVTDLQPGTTYYFAATAYSNDGAESDYSNEVSYTVPQTCTYAISPGSQTVPASGGTGSIQVTTQSSCGWSASGAEWMSINSGTNGTGSGTVSYTVSANTGSSRMASSTIAGHIFTITQDGVVSYTITASAGTGGSISPSGSVNVTSGSTQSFSITPSSGYTVSSVTVDGSSAGTVSSYTFSNVTANHTIAAAFTPQTYTLTTSKTGTGSGTVTNSPTGISFNSGTQVTLTASAASGSSFTGWSGACSGTATTCTVTMNANTTVSANFTPTTYTLSIAKTGTGSGTVSTNPTGTSFTSGTSVTLTAAAATGSSFTGWSGACSGTATTCTVTMNANKTVSANFTLLNTYTITASAGTGGSISPSGSVNVTSGSTQSFSITPSSGYTVSSVTVDGSSAGTVSSYTFSNVTANHTIAAAFTPQTYTLTTSKTGTGSGTVTNSPTGISFNSGTQVTLTASAASGSSFTGWSGACSGTATTCTVTMNADTTVSANFTLLNAYTITASAGTGGSISPSGSVSVASGGRQTFTVSIDPNYVLGSLLVDGRSVNKKSSFTFTGIRANHTISASFIPLYTHNVTKTGSGIGSVRQSRAGSTFKAGTLLTLTAAASTTSVFTGWSGACSGTSNKCVVTMNDNTNVTAIFTLKSYNVTATSETTGTTSLSAIWPTNGATTMVPESSVPIDLGGDISPNGAITADHGSSRTFTVTPAPGFKIKRVVVNGVSKGAVGSLTISNIRKNQKIVAIFTPDTTPVASPSQTLALNGN